MADENGLKSWLKENRGLVILIGLLLLVAAGIYFFIQRQFAARQIRIESVKAERIIDWTPSPAEVVDPLDSENIVVPPLEEQYDPLIRQIEPLSDYGPAIRFEDYLIELEKLEAPELLGTSLN